MFECKNLCFSYYKSPLCLKDVNFSVAKNSKNLILASKEMGKTTILKVLSGFEDSRFGNIYYNGAELKSVSDEKKNFSLVLSDVVLFDKKTIKDNIDYQCEVRNIEILSEKQINLLLKEFNIEKSFNEKVKKLTLFEKRKLQIVRAFIKNPAILFLDDQFEGLSDEDKKEMLEIYKIVLNKFNSTIFFAIGDDTFKRFEKDFENFKFDNVLYLNLANVTLFENLNEFKESYSSLDFLKFKTDVYVESGYIEKDNSGYFFCKDELKLFKFDKNFDLKLDKLLLNFAEIEECVLCFKHLSDVSKLASDEMNKLLFQKDVFIFSSLTGNRVI